MQAGVEREEKILLHQMVSHPLCTALLFQLGPASSLPGKSDTDGPSFEGPFRVHPSFSTTLFLALRYLLFSPFLSRYSVIQRADSHAEEAFSGRIRHRSVSLCFSLGFDRAHGRMEYLHTDGSRVMAALPEGTGDWYAKRDDSVGEQERLLSSGLIDSVYCTCSIPVEGV